MFLLCSYINVMDLLCEHKLTISQMVFISKVMLSILLLHVGIRVLKYTILGKVGLSRFFVSFSCPFSSFNLPLPPLDSLENFPRPSVLEVVKRNTPGIQRKT